MEIIPHSRPWIRDVDQRNVSATLATGMVARGGLVEEFERQVAARQGGRGAVATSSGTAALVLALRALGAGPGLQVVIPSYVCPDVLRAVRMVGASPMLCDIALDWRMSPELIRGAITTRTVAVIAVSIFGFSVPVRALADLGPPVIVDAAQGFGAKWTGAAAAVYSFHATKCLTTGEGGMVLFANEDLFALGRELFETESHAARMSDLQASLGISQLADYSDFVRRRRVTADRYRRELSGTPLVLPIYGDDDIPFRFPVRTTGDFEKLRRMFFEEGIHVRRGVDRLLHRDLGLDDTKFPTARQLFDETVSIPLYPGLTEGEIGAVAGAARRILGSLQR